MQGYDVLMIDWPQNRNFSFDVFSGNLKAVKFISFWTVTKKDAIGNAMQTNKKK